MDWQSIYAPNGRHRANAFDSWDLFVFDNGWQKPLNESAPNSHGRRVRSFARTSWNVKVKSQRSRSQGTKNALCTHNTPAVWTKWNGLVADNVVQAAGASILSLARGVFAGMRSACGMRWAWPATARLCHAFLVYICKTKMKFIHTVNGDRSKTAKIIKRHY